MKKPVLLFLFISIGIMGYAQCNTFKGAPHYIYGDTIWKEYKYCVETSDTTWNEPPMTSIPEFKGDLDRWFADSTNYTELVLGFNQERVVLSFNVEKDGFLSNIKILRHVTKYQDSTFIRAMLKMPKWKPGILNHYNVKTAMVLSIKLIVKDVQCHTIYIGEHAPIIDSVY